MKKEKRIRKKKKEKEEKKEKPDYITIGLLDISHKLNSNYVFCTHAILYLYTTSYS